MNEEERLRISGEFFDKYKKFIDIDLITHFRNGTVIEGELVGTIVIRTRSGEEYHYKGDYITLDGEDIKDPLFYDMMDIEKERYMDRALNDYKHVRYLAKYIKSKD